MLYLKQLATATDLHSRRSDVDIFRSVVSIFQYPRHRSQPPVLSDNSLRWSSAHCDKMFPPTTVSYEERDENHREPRPDG